VQREIGGARPDDVERIFARLGNSGNVSAQVAAREDEARWDVEPIAFRRVIGVECNQPVLQQFLPADMRPTRDIAPGCREMAGA
jgi:hypothetical protein